MKRDAKTYLHDIYEACEYIQTFTQGMSIEDYRQSELVRAAVERKFAIIGEAPVQLRSDYPKLLNRISDTDKIIGFRNVLVHRYNIIDDATVWSAVKTNLTMLL